MKRIIQTLFLSIIISTIAISLIIYPGQALEASIRGLNIWWEIVFPSLLPFFITSEILIAFGVVKFIGVLFEPIMRPIFNVPGVGSFAWVMGMASGYPSGAKICARLREENQISRIEAERLLSFTNASSPLFIFGAVAVGFFHNAKLGLLIAVCHYLGNTIVGICMRFYGVNKEDKKQKNKHNKLSIVKAFKEMHNTRIKDPRPLGEMLGDAILNSIKTLVMVGGFIIFFSVLTKLMTLIGISMVIAMLFEYILELTTLPAVLSSPLISGLFEITMGAQMISELDINILAQVIAVSFILGFNGFSVQAQVSSIIATTDIRFTPYFISRLLHAFIASILTIILFKPLYIQRYSIRTSDSPITTDLDSNYFALTLETLKLYGPIITILSLVIALIILLNKIWKSAI